LWQLVPYRQPVRQLGNTVSTAGRGQTSPVSASSGGGCTNAISRFHRDQLAYSSSGSILGAYTYTWTVSDVGTPGLPPTSIQHRRQFVHKMELPEWEPGGIGCRIDLVLV